MPAVKGGSTIRAAPPEARGVFAGIEKLLGGIAADATGTIVNTETFILPPSGKHIFQNLTTQQARNALKTRMESRIAYLPYMADWLNSHRKEGSPIPERHAVAPELFAGLGHPAYLSELIQHYVSLGILLPPEEVRDNNMPVLCDRAMHMERASAALRGGMPLAFSVYEYHARRLIAALDRHLDRPQEGQDYTPPTGRRGFIDPLVGKDSVEVLVPDSTWEPPARVPGRHSPPFLPDEIENPRPPITHTEYRYPGDIGKFVEKMVAGYYDANMPEKFVELGVALEVFEKGEVNKETNERKLYTSVGGGPKKAATGVLYKPARSTLQSTPGSLGRPLLLYSILVPTVRRECPIINAERL